MYLVKILKDCAKYHETALSISFQIQANPCRVFKKEDGKHVGYVDFSTLLRDPFQWGRMGYTIHNQFWKMGYGKEAVKAAIQLAFEQINYHRLEEHINLDNLPSVKLAESVGMQFE